jgi:HK97 family phage major capsid protein
MKSNELRQKRANLIHQARELVEAADSAKRDMSAEENTQYDRIMADVEKLQGQIDQREKLEGLESELGEVTSQAERPEGRSSATSDAAKEKAEMRAFLINGSKGPILRARSNGAVSPELRALQADADASGGYTIAPEQFVNSLIKAIDDETFIRQFANVQQLTSAQSLGQPYLANDPGDATWTSEILIGSEDSTMSFGKRELTPHPLARFIKVSNKMLRLNPAVDALVIQRMGYKFGIAFEKAGMTGTGVNSPLGVFTASNDGISTGRDVSTGNTTTSIQTDGLQEAKYSLKGGYWRNARWIFHRSALKQIAKLQDGDDQYIWQQGLAVGAPDTLLNFPVHMSEYAPSTFTTGQYVGILGDFQYYHIVDSLEMSIQRLVELYAATNQTGFIGRMESDGMPVLEEAFARVKLA